MKVEHEDLHGQLRKATRESGGVGEAAKAVSKVLHPHFLKEEEYALPPLGLLAALAKGPITADMAAVLPMTEKLKTERNEMLADHQSIVAALLDSVSRSAYVHREWWPNQSDTNSRPQARAGTNARFTVEPVHPAPNSEWVRFRRR